MGAARAVPARGLAIVAVLALILLSSPQAQAVVPRSHPVADALLQEGTGAGDDVGSALEAATDPTGPRPTAGPIDLAPSQTKYADVGAPANYTLTVTNLDTVARIADITWDAPPTGWTAAVFASDGVTPLGDANGNSRPDVALGPAGSPTDAEDIVLRIVVALRPNEDSARTNVTADAGPGGTDVATLTTIVLPFLRVDRWADPTTINRLGMGSNEVTTVTLDLEGRGTAIPGVKRNSADVVFVIDDTGSMGGVIDVMVAEVDEFVGCLQQNLSDLRFGLVSYKDDDPPKKDVHVDIGLTYDVAAFEAALFALVAEGGADWEEDPDVALDLATTLAWRGGSSIGKVMVLIGDAPAHDDIRLTQVAYQAHATRDIHTSTVAVGVSPETLYWWERTAENGSGLFTQVIVSMGRVIYGDLSGSLINSVLYVVPPVDLAASDWDLSDGDRMIRDVLPPHIAVVPGTFRDPSTMAAKNPAYQGTDGNGNTVLEWNQGVLKVNDTWRVQFNVTSSLAGLVPTNVYGLSRVSYNNWSGVHRETLFPEVDVKVLAPSPRTTLSVGQPNVTAADTWVTSATPLSLSVEDVAGTGIAATWYRVDNGTWQDYNAGGPFTLSGEGRHAIEWYSEDLLGTLEPVNAAELIVDDTPPATDLSVGTPSFLSNDTYVTSATPIALPSADPGTLPVGLNATRARIDGGFPFLYAGPFTLVGEGLHTIEFWADDLLGNAEPPTAVRIVVDDTPPSTVASIGSPHHLAVDHYIRSTTPITLQCADGGVTPVGIEGIRYQVDGGGAATYSVPITIAGEGRHRLEFWSVDLLGNAEGAGSLDVIVDDTPPTTGLAVGSPSRLSGNTYIRSTTPLTLQSSDGGAIPVGLNATFYRIDGGSPTAYSSPVTIAGDGLHAIEFWSVDWLGNAEAAGSLDVIVDDTPPTTGLTVGSPSHLAGDICIRSSTPLTLQSSDGGANPVGLNATFYRIDGGSPIVYSSPFTISQEGAHLVEFWSEDLLGNAEPPRTLRVIVDDTPPATSISFGTPTYLGAERFLRSTTPITLQSADGGIDPVGLDRTYLTIDGGNPIAYVAPFTVSGEGLHTIEFWSVDLLGNGEAASSARIVVDDTPPETTISIGTPSYSTFSTLYVTSKTEFALGSTDGGAMPVGVAVVECRTDGGAWAACDASFHVTGSDGPRTVEFRATDLLGNEEGVRSSFVYLDNTPPTTTIDPASGTFTEATVFTLAAADAGSGVRLTECEVDAWGWMRFGLGFRLEEGVHNIAYRSTDNLGNREVERSLHVIIEGAPPPPPPTVEEVAVNHKPLVALVFSVALGIAGAWAATRRPWKGLPTKKAIAKAFAACSLPFVAAEAATGVVSCLTGLLAIPPLLGLGTVVDVAILVAGLVVAALRFRGEAPVAPPKEIAEPPPPD